MGYQETGMPEEIRREIEKEEAKENQEAELTHKQGNPTETKGRKLPGGAVPERSLWESRVQPGEGGQLKEIGVRAPDGTYYELQEGERFAINKGEGEDYEAVIIGPRGEQRVLRKSLANEKAEQEQHDGGIRQKTGEEEINNKDVSSGRFWERLRDKGWKPHNVEDMRQAFSEMIRSAVASGRLSLQLGPEEPTEADKEKMAALRQMAREMGYEVSQFQRSEESFDIMSAEISKREEPKIEE